MASSSGASKALLAVCVVAGCTPAAAQGIQLSCDLTGDDVTLTWAGNRDDVVVEFATEPDGQYTILGFVPASRHRYVHPDLMPATTFYYRLRPVEGPASDDATAVPAADRVEGEDWLVPRTVPDTRAAPEPGGRPTNLRVESVTTDGLRLTWTDNSTDEDGFLIERQARTGFEVVFVVDPDVNYAGLIASAADTYRVRAYHYGRTSNVVSERTP
ncbi:fibronectin type III domain-containing protein [Actinophytocola sp.]|uniref:fibronectin type III domain-containing protein n=1 Tax=Actinophytocola sp. TaxID=1872138 RepID=UPI00389A450A